MNTRGLALLEEYARHGAEEALAALDGDLPNSVVQLKPFLPVPLDDAILDRYELVQTGNVNVAGFSRSNILVGPEQTSAAIPLWQSQRLKRAHGALWRPKIVPCSSFTK